MTVSDMQVKNILKCLFIQSYLMVIGSEKSNETKRNKQKKSFYTVYPNRSVAIPSLMSAASVYKSWIMLL